VDFRLVFSVARRFKWVLGPGFVLACLLASLTVVKIGPNGLAYRQAEKWVSTARVLVTSPNNDASQLAVTFSSLATGDQVTRKAIRRHGVHGLLQADFGYVNRTSTALPTVSLSAISASPEKAAILANDSVPALQAVIAQQQTEAGVPRAKQAQLQLLNRALASEALVATPRSKTPPVVVFILVMAATIGLVFILENLRPRVHVVPAEFGPAEFGQSRATGEAASIRQQA
jgi:hypothetical protein